MTMVNFSYFHLVAAVEVEAVLEITNFFIHPYIFHHPAFSLTALKTYLLKVC